MTNDVNDDDEMRKMVDKLAVSISRLCHMVIAKRLGQFFEVIGDELRKPEMAGAGAVMSQAETSPAIQQLMKFYGVTSLEKLALIQSERIEKLQAKLSPLRGEQSGPERQG